MSRLPYNVRNGLVSFYDAVSILSFFLFIFPMLSIYSIWCMISLCFLVVTYQSHLVQPIHVQIKVPVLFKVAHFNASVHKVTQDSYAKVSFNLPDGSKSNMV